MYRLLVVLGSCLLSADLYAGYLGIDLCKKIRESGQALSLNYTSTYTVTDGLLKIIQTQPGDLQVTAGTRVTDRGDADELRDPCNINLTDVMLELIQAQR